MSRQLSLLTLTTLTLLLIGCGGGSNSNPPGAVSLFGSADVAVVQGEMIKDISPVIVPVTLGLNSNLDNIDPTVGVVTLENYTITYTRNDGGVVPAPLTGTLGQSLSVGNNSPSSLTFDLLALHADEKLYSSFAQSFLADPDPVNLSCRVVVNGRTTSGDAKTTSFGFSLQLAVFDPNNALVPTIPYINQTTGILYPGDYAATWLTEGEVSDGVFFLPWGDWLILPGTASFFPIGSIAVTTAVLGLEPGQSLTADSGVLVVNNRYGSASTSENDMITVTALPEIIPDPPAAVDILQFYADKTEVTPGEDVVLTWVVTGAVDKLELLPDTYNGVTVDFSGQDLSFGSITIQPTETVRPILKASNEVSEAVRFLGEAITVAPAVDPTAPPSIDFFRVDRTTVSVGRSVVFYWQLSGAIDKVEMFPFNGNIFDVTGLNSLVSPPGFEAGTVTFSLVVFGTDGTIARQDINVTWQTTVNGPVTITDYVAQPGAAINNGDEASFTFRVTDPERHDSSWKVQKISGDGASHFPRDGTIPNGDGPAAVAVRDYIDNENGYLTYLIEAWDDEIFGFSGAATKAVLLANFTTNGVLSDNAPVIDAFTFTPSGPATAPGTEGSLDFIFSDPDTLDLRWTLYQVSGDIGGSLSSTTGTVDNGRGVVQVSYVDDPDSPADPVVFLLRVEEISGQNRQHTVLSLRVGKGDGAVDGGTTTPTGDPIAFALSALYGNFNGDPASTALLSDRRIYFNGDLADPRFYQNPDGSGELPGLSFVVDILHEGGDPGVISNVTYSRNFQTPTNSAGNTGNLDFVNYYPSTGDRVGGSPSPIANGVARFRMTFTTEDFRPTGSDPFNLPTAGSTTYTLAMVAADTTGTTQQFSTDITVTVITP